MVWCVCCVRSDTPPPPSGAPSLQERRRAHGTRRCMLTHGGLVVVGGMVEQTEHSTHVQSAVENVTSLDTKKDILIR